MKRLTAIVPCFNEQEVLPLFYDEIVRVANLMKDKVEFEFLYINDGSSDKTLSVLKELRKKDHRMKYISFSRNFGKEAAMYAGLEHATGDYVAILDADLQHPPIMLMDMYQGIVEEGYDCVAARRITRKGEPKIRSFFSRKFYKLISKLSKIEIVEGSVDYRLMTRPMVEAILKMSEKNRFTKGIFGWIGFHTKWLDYDNVERVAGETKWSFWKLIKYSMEGIIGFSTAPLAMSSVLGLAFCVVAFLAIIYIIVKTLIWGDPTSGWPSLACLILMVGGIQLFCMGILGQYLGKAYIEVKNRPIYLASIVEVEDDNEETRKESLRNGE